MIVFLGTSVSRLREQQHMEAHLRELEALDFRFSFSAIPDNFSDDARSSSCYKGLEGERVNLSTLGEISAPCFGEVIWLNLFNVRGAQSGSGWLSDFVSLESLWIEGGAINDRCLASVRDLQHLRELRVVGVDLDDPGLLQFGDLSKIKVLSFSNNRVSSAGLQSSNLQSAKEIYLANTLVGPDLTFLSSASSELSILDLRNTGVTDASMQQIASFPQLEVLVLSGTAVSDAGVRELLRMHALKDLRLRGTGVSNDCIQQLATALPKLRIGI